ncbi:MAG: NAD+ synthase [Chloroflexi bacterium]|nr:NAD+ synthase [Chloroflexota bacterium]
MSTFRVALAQINMTVGDLDGNTEKVRQGIATAKSLGANLVAFPELTITGYPPEDLLFKPQFIADNRARLEGLLPASKGITAVVGFVDADRDIYNAAAILHDGKLAGVYRKMYLPTYGVFDEDRYFKAGHSCPVFNIGGVTVGVNICEDIWYPGGPTLHQANAGAQVIVTINGSPYYAGKVGFREKFVATRAIDHGIYVCYVNIAGGQDELVFDGNSVIFDPDGEAIARGKTFEEDMVVADLSLTSLMGHRLRSPLHRKVKHGALPEGVTAPVIPLDAPPAAKRPPLPAQKPAPLEPIAETYKAIVTGVRDYVRKNGFKRVLLGLSGGIDSSLVASIATDALGPERVVGIGMPSRYSSKASLEDASALAKNLGIEFHVIGIEPAFEAMLSMLGGMFEGTEANVAEENIQSRIRGNILMAISNKFGWLVLATGNKTELAMGFATLYGDMSGGYAVIKDVQKTVVYELARYRNRAAGKALIPERILTKPASPELKADQRTEESLLPFSILDPILKAYVEEEKSYADLLAMGFAEAHVKRVMTQVDRNEYKRRQAPPGVKITPRAFGRDRRLPIVNKYKAF